MAYRHQWQLQGGKQTIAERAWLASLVETFETMSRDPVRSSNPTTIAALKAQLARPASAMAASFIALH